MTERIRTALEVAAGVALVDAMGYFLYASLVWLWFYVIFKVTQRQHRISAKEPTTDQIRSELYHSMISIAIFGMAAGALVFAALNGFTRVYWNIDDYGWGWFWASIGVMIVMHDTYFYWTHRLMHTRWLFRSVHLLHHRSVSPTPWAAYSFSPWEAIVQAGIGPVIAMTIPTHWAAFGLFMFWQIGFNVFGHCGYEFFTPDFLRSWRGSILNSPTHHTLHHERFGTNFSLYFNFWDWLMGTNHPEYQHRFEQAAGMTEETLRVVGDEAMPHDDLEAEERRRDAA
ncbi:MAG TPA: sterol desaturase family protein [Gemmatales bacterium]|nr:sterol desaturase family protein [Gemmatales bacterium]HMP57912.1 sterol desaturase family protein [Gemmatales bacterium]